MLGLEEKDKNMVENLSGSCNEHRATDMYTIHGYWWTSSHLSLTNQQQIYYENSKPNDLHTFIQKGFDLTAIYSISWKRGVIFSIDIEL